MGADSCGSSCIEQLESRCLRSGGTVTTYGDDGIAFPSAGGESANDQAICAAPNGGAFVLRDGILARLLDNGTVDSSFGGGSVNVDVNASYSDATEVAATPDGGAIVELDDDSNGDEGLIRFNSDGSRDTAFGIDGVVDTAAYNAAFTNAVYPGPVTVEGDGSILWAFSLTDQIDTGDPLPILSTSGFVERLSSTGQVDSAFANGLAPSDPDAILVDPAGTLFLPGTTGFQQNDEGMNAPINFGIQADNSDGSGNEKYGSGSYSQFDQFVVSNNLLGAVVDSKGRVTVDGIINGKATMLRFTASGKLDKTFGKDGKVVLSGLSFTGSESNNLIRESDGSFLIGGDATPKGAHGFHAAVQHYTANGVFDPAYGGSGLGILTSKDGLLVGDAATLVAGPNGTFLVSTTLRDTFDGASRQRLVIDDIAAS